MESSQVIGLVLAGVLVGALLPVLYQVWRTLQAAQRFFDETGRDAGNALREIAQTADRLERLIEKVEEPVHQVQAALRAAGDLTRMLRGTQSVVKNAFLVGGAVGPALMAAGRALFARGGDDGGSAGPHEETTPNIASGNPGGSGE